VAEVVCYRCHREIKAFTGTVLTTMEGNPLAECEACFSDSTMIRKDLKSGEVVETINKITPVYSRVLACNRPSGSSRKRSGAE